MVVAISLILLFQQSAIDFPSLHHPNLPKHNNTNFKENPKQKYSLITPSPPLPLNPTKTRNTDLNSHPRLITFFITSDSLLLRRPRHGADYFRVPHFEVGGTVCGGLSADLGGEATELVPSAPIKTKKGKGVGGCVEWHFGCRWGALGCRYFAAQGHKHAKKNIT